MIVLAARLVVNIESSLNWNQDKIKYYKKKDM